VDADLTNCRNCGGPLPAPPRATGFVRAERPPDPPRTLPSGYPLRITLTSNVFVIIGIVFTLVSVPFSLAFLGAGLAEPEVMWGALGGLVFGAVGLPMLIFGLRRARRKLDALRHGVVADGMILGVTLNTSTTINGQHPWRIDYVFDGPEGPVEGRAESWDLMTGQLEQGEPVWVVWVRGDPSRNAIWPPVR